MVKARKNPTEYATSGCEERASALTFALPPMMTIKTAEELAGELKQLPLSETMHLVLDASHVTNISTPGIQLIIGLEKTLASKGGRLSITGQNETFTHSFADTGLSKFLENPSS